MKELKIICTSVAGPYARSASPHGKLVMTALLNHLPMHETWMPQTYLLLRMHSFQSNHYCQFYICGPPAPQVCLTFHPVLYYPLFTQLDDSSFCFLQSTDMDIER